MHMLTQQKSTQTMPHNNTSPNKTHKTNNTANTTHSIDHNIRIIITHLILPIK